jgi:hypothetical protein
METMTDGFVAVVKRECPTCELVVPVLRSLDATAPLHVFVQDDPSYDEGLRHVVDDSALEVSYRYGIETVPTLIRVAGGQETERVVGWDRDAWRAITGIDELADGLPALRPGCGSRTRDPGMPAKLRVRYGETGLVSRTIEVPDEIDPIEACYDRGWSDGLPVVPPTRERVLEMLDGTRRKPDEIVGLVPPNLAPCTVEKVAINAVMAGCKPEYLPVVLAAVQTALLPEFHLHAVLATTNAVGPVVMINGPIARTIGMNAKGNVFGQGNRANATIGRALQLVVRNVGGGRPGEIDRAVFGNPGKYTFCFAEDDEDQRWESYAVSLGYAPDASTVTIFAGDGNTPIVDHTSRTPEELCRSFAGCLNAIYHPGHVISVQAFLAVGGEHAQVFYDAGWSKQRVLQELEGLLRIPTERIVPGRAGRDGLTLERLAAPDVPKFATGPFNIIRAGGSAGKYSAIISSIGTFQSIHPVTREITL